MRVVIEQTSVPGEEGKEKKKKMPWKMLPNCTVLYDQERVKELLKRNFRK
jgi:hypothetical protein